MRPAQHGSPRSSRGPAGCHAVMLRVAQETLATTRCAEVPDLSIELSAVARSRNDHGHAAHRINGNFGRVNYGRGSDGQWFGLRFVLFSYDFGEDAERYFLGALRVDVQAGGVLD